jgi:hypothetical protein
MVGEAQAPGHYPRRGGGGKTLLTAFNRLDNNCGESTACCVCGRGGGAGGGVSWRCVWGQLTACEGGGGQQGAVCVLCHLHQERT